MPNTDPNADLAQYIREVVQESAASNNVATASGTPTSTNSEPLTLSIAGQQFAYKSKAELEAALNNFVAATGQKVGELQSQLQNAPQSGSFITDDTDVVPVWSDKEFVDRMTKSPKEGLDYWLNQTIFDGKSDDPTADIKRALTETELTKRSIAAYQFKENHPEFPGGQQAANIIDSVRQQMNLPYDYNGLEAAYLIAQQRGQLQNYMAQAQQQQFLQQQAAAMQQGYKPEEFNPYLSQHFPQGQQFQSGQGPIDPRAWNGGFGQINMNVQEQAYAQNPYLQAPPGANRNAPYNMGNNIDPETLSIEQIEQVFARAGQPVQGGARGR